MSSKLVSCLSSAVICCISVNPVAAIDVISEYGSRSTQTIGTNPLKTIEREQRKREREERKREREERIELRRQEREQQRLQRQQALEQRQKELEAARQSATEQQRLEAERRRQYFESLSPEAQKAYLAEQQAQRAQANKAASLFLMMLFAGGSGSSQQNDSQIPPCYTLDDFVNSAGGKNCRL